MPTEWEISFIHGIIAVHHLWVVLPTLILHSAIEKFFVITLNTYTNETIIAVFSFYPFIFLVKLSCFAYATCCSLLPSWSLQCLYLAGSHLFLLTQMEHFYNVYFVSLNDSQCFHDLCIHFPDEVFHNHNKLNEWHTVCRYLFALCLVTEKQLVLEKQNMEFWITAIFPS